MSTPGPDRVRRRTLALIVAGALAVVALVVGGALVAASMFGGAAGGDRTDGCTTRFGTECSDIPLEKLEEAFEVDLPEGTTVVNSNYVEFQDWRLTATFELGGPFEVPAEFFVEGADGDGVFCTADLDGTTLTLTMFTA